MNQDLGLKVLSQIMNWTDDRARHEFNWLKLMARLKYDGYRDFQAGMRFIESLATWLQQFKQQDRETAYAFVRQNLVYISHREMQQLVGQFYPRFVRELIARIVAKGQNMKPYQVVADKEAKKANKRLRRQTLFMGLSDGAHIDTIRHAHTGLLTNEQFVQGTQIDTGKWKDLLQHLRDDLQDQTAGFRLVYLIDDFTASGSSFLRFDKDKREWKGKFIRFRESVESANNSLGDESVFEGKWELCIHHHLASWYAKDEIKKRLEKVKPNGTFREYWAQDMHMSFGMVLPKDLPINAAREHHDDFIKLSQNYYDPAIRTKHTDIGGVDHLGLGFGGCALPLVLEHNTPNNSVALLWAETDGSFQNGAQAPAMRPLFRRRQRHV